MSQDPKVDSLRETHEKEGWASFWSFQHNAFYDVMQIATAYFTKQLIKRYGINERHAVLDYGCGPGFLTARMVGKGIQVTGADINAALVEQARRRHRGAIFIHISDNIIENKKILETALRDKQFDFIVFLSIAQYFPDINAFEKVIQLTSSYAAPGAKMIVADVIDKQTSSFRDAMGLLYQCIRKVAVVAFLRFVLFVIFSDYSRVFKRNGLLEIEKAEMEAMAHRNSWQCEKVEGLTIHPSRKNYILQKK